MDDASQTVMPYTNVDGFQKVVPNAEHYHSGVEEAGRRSAKVSASVDAGEGPFIDIIVAQGDELSAEVYAFTDVASTEQVQANMQPTIRQVTSSGDWEVNTPLFGTYVTPTDQGGFFDNQVYFNFLSLIGLFNGNNDNGGNITTDEDSDSYAYGAYLKMELYTAKNTVPVETRMKAVTIPTDQLGQTWSKVVLGWESPIDWEQYCTGGECPSPEPFIRVSVVNESEDNGQDVPIWFDDMAVYKNAPGLEVLHHADYYPFGHTMREDYSRHFHTLRHGYQGDFSEKDEETGWNHFELREYDAVIGRWLVPDSYRQHWSPYLAMGNSPTNRIDPNGGCDNPADCPDFYDFENDKFLGVNGDGFTEWINMMEAITVTPPPTMLERLVAAAEHYSNTHSFVMQSELDVSFGAQVGLDLFKKAGGKFNYTIFGNNPSDIKHSYYMQDGTAKIKQELSVEFLGLGGMLGSEFQTASGLHGYQRSTLVHKAGIKTIPNTLPINLGKGSLSGGGELGTDGSSKYGLEISAGAAATLGIEGKVFIGVISNN